MGRCMVTLFLRIVSLVDHDNQYKPNPSSFLEVIFFFFFSLVLFVDCIVLFSGALAITSVLLFFLPSQNMAQTV